MSIGRCFFVGTNTGTLVKSAHHRQSAEKPKINSEIENSMLSISTKAEMIQHLNHLPALPELPSRLRFSLTPERALTRAKIPRYGRSI
jgi:hypothetical protein